LGLGLAIAKRSADLLEHNLSFQSVLGKGTCFKIDVPYGTAQAIQAAIVSDEKLLDSPSNLNVLCIDNEPQILLGLKRLLSGWGYHVTVAESKDDALKLWLKEPRPNKTGPKAPDVILADYHLDNNTNGLNAMDSFRQEFGVETPGVLISADNSEWLQKEVESLGYFYLAKPVKPASLRALLRKLQQDIRLSPTRSLSKLARQTRTGILIISPERTSIF